MEKNSKYTEEEDGESISANINNPLEVVQFFFLLNPRIYLLKGANLRFKGKYHYKDKYKPPFWTIMSCRSKTSSAGLGKNKPPQGPLVWDQPHILPKERTPPHCRQFKQEPAGSSKKTHTVYSEQRKHKTQKK